MSLEYRRESLLDSLCEISHGLGKCGTYTTLSRQKTLSLQLDKLAYLRSVRKLENVTCSSAISP